MQIVVIIKLHVTVIQLNDVWGYPIYCDITVIVYYEDGTSADFTTDSRTMYSIPISAGNSLLQFNDWIEYRVEVNETSPTDTYGNGSVQLIWYI